MKKTILLLLVVTVFGLLQSCKKEEDLPTNCEAIKTAIADSTIRISRLQGNLANASEYDRQRIIDNIANEKANLSNLQKQKSSMGC